MQGHQANGIELMMRRVQGAERRLDNLERLDAAQRLRLPARLAEAEATNAQQAGQLTNAFAQISDVAARADRAQAVADGAVGLANSAQAAANQANADNAAQQSSLNGLWQNATDQSREIGAAQSAAASAQSRADAAFGYADSAQASANRAQASANSAYAYADSAQAQANTATAMANNLAQRINEIEAWLRRNTTYPNDGGVLSNGIQT